MEVVQHLEFLVESLIGIVEKNENDIQKEKQQGKPVYNREFFRELITLEKKIRELIELAEDNVEESKVVASLEKKFKLTMKNYQNSWEDSYWSTYNSTRIETEYTNSPTWNSDDTWKDEELILKDLDDRIDILNDRTILSENTTKEKDRFCSNCTIF